MVLRAWSMVHGAKDREQRAWSERHGAKSIGLKAKG